jgi:hypothetical protein
MKSRPTQFGVRENTASSRQHAPRLAMNAMQLQFCEPTLVVNGSCPPAAHTPPKPTKGATVEEEENGSPKYLVTPLTAVVEHDVQGICGWGSVDWTKAKAHSTGQAVGIAGNVSMDPRPCNDGSGTDKERRSASASKTSLWLCG